MLYTEKELQDTLKKDSYDIKRNRKADAGNLCTDQKRYKNIKKAGQKAYQYGSRCGTCRDSDLRHNRRSCVYQCTYRSAWQCVRTAEPYDKRSL